MYMALCTFNSVISTIFTIVVLVSANDSDKVLKDLNWSNGDFLVDYDVDATIWVSIYQYGAGNKDKLEKVDWTSQYCIESYCSECESTMKIVLAFIVLHFIFTVVSVIASSYRCIPTENTQRAKNLCILMSFLSVGFGTVSLIEYSTGCERKIKDWYRENIYTDVTWFYGPSYGLLIAAVSLSFINLWCHWRTPISADPRSEEYHRNLLDNSKH